MTFGHSGGMDRVYRAAVMKRLHAVQVSQRPPFFFTIPLSLLLFAEISDNYLHAPWGYCITVPYSVLMILTMDVLCLTLLLIICMCHEFNRE